MLVCGKEIDFKISRLSNAAALDNALKLMEKDEDKLKKMPKDAGVVKVISAGLTMFRNFFENATGIDVLECCDDLEDATKAYYDFLDAIKAQKKTILMPYDADSVE